MRRYRDKEIQYFFDDVLPGKKLLFIPRLIYNIVLIIAGTLFTDIGVY